MRTKVVFQRGENAWKASWMETRFWSQRLRRNLIREREGQSKVQILGGHLAWCWLVTFEISFVFVTDLATLISKRKYSMAAESSSQFPVLYYLSLRKLQGPFTWEKGWTCLIRRTLFFGHVFGLAVSKHCSPISASVWERVSRPFQNYRPNFWMCLSHKLSRKYPLLEMSTEAVEIMRTIKHNAPISRF